MPWGNGTGPAGLGPMTGRAAGYCAGFNMPGYLNPGFGYRGAFAPMGRGAYSFGGPYAFGPGYAPRAFGLGRRWAPRFFGRGGARGWAGRRGRR